MPAYAWSPRCKSSCIRTRLRFAMDGSDSIVPWDSPRLLCKVAFSSKCFSLAFGTYVFQRQSIAVFNLPRHQQRGNEEEAIYAAKTPSVPTNGFRDLIR